MKIYYAHHIWKYGTPIETFEMSVIKNEFDFEDGFEIVNPKDALPQNIPESEIMKQTFAMIDQCDAVVFSTVSGVIGHGVFDEVMYALNKGIQVFCLMGDDCYLVEDKDIFKDVIFQGDNRVYALVHTPLEYEDQEE